MNITFLANTYGFLSNYKYSLSLLLIDKKNVVSWVFPGAFSDFPDPPPRGLQFSLLSSSRSGPHFIFSLFVSSFFDGNILGQKYENNPIIILVPHYIK